MSVWIKEWLKIPYVLGIILTTDNSKCKMSGYKNHLSIHALLTLICCLMFTLLWSLSLMQIITQHITTTVMQSGMSEIHIHVHVFFSVQSDFNLSFKYYNYFAHLIYLSNQATLPILFSSELHFHRKYLCIIWYNIYVFLNCKIYWSLQV